MRRLLFWGVSIPPRPLLGWVPGEKGKGWMVMLTASNSELLQLQTAQIPRHNRAAVQRRGGHVL